MTNKTVEQARAEFVDALARLWVDPHGSAANMGPDLSAARALLGALESNGGGTAGAQTRDSTHSEGVGGSLGAARADVRPAVAREVSTTPADPPKPADRTAEELLESHVAYLRSEESIPGLRRGSPADMLRLARRLVEVTDLVRELRAERDEFDAKRNEWAGKWSIAWSERNFLEDERDALAARIEKAKAEIRLNTEYPHNEWCSSNGRLMRILEGKE